MRGLIIRLPFWLGACVAALLIRLEIIPLVSISLAYVLGFAAGNMASQIGETYRRIDEKKKAKGIYW